jgi:D-sedoheptulose 7-phosphate isomerase
MLTSITTIKERLRLAATVNEAMAESGAASIAAAADLIANCFRSNGKVLLCGNGGSAADCQHMATELVGRLTHDKDRPGLPAIA